MFQVCADNVGARVVAGRNRKWNGKRDPPSQDHKQGNTFLRVASPSPIVGTMVGTIGEGLNTLSEVETLVGDGVDSCVGGGAVISKSVMDSSKNE